MRTPNDIDPHDTGAIALGILAMLLLMGFAFIVGAVTAPYWYPA